MPFTVTVTERGEPSETLGFSQPEVTIGRVRGNDIVLRRGSVSKRHAKLVVDGDRVVVVDLKSTNGTIVNGRKISSPAALRPSDKVIVGDYVLEVGYAVSEAPRAPAAQAPALPRFARMPGGRAGRDRPPTPLEATVSASASSLGTRPTADASDTGGELATVPFGADLEPLIDDARAMGLRPAAAASEEASAPARPREDDDERYGLGPIADYLDDPEVLEVHVNAWNSVFVRRAGALVAGTVSFDSRADLDATARRLATGEATADSLGCTRHLADGTRVEVLLPPNVPEPVIFVARAQATRRDLPALVRERVIDERVAAALRVALEHGGRLLLCAARTHHASELASAIVGALPDGLRVVVCGPGAVASGSRSAIHVLPAAGAIPRLVGRLVGLGPDVLVVDPLTAPLAGDLFTSEGPTCAVAATFAAREAADALARLPLVAARAAGSTPAVVLPAIATGIDLVVALRRRGDVVAVAEVVEPVVADGALHGVPVFERAIGTDAVDLVPSGHVPRLFRDLRDDGVRYDPSLFDS